MVQGWDGIRRGLLLLMIASPVSAQQGAAGPEFDAVSVKLVDPNVRGVHSNKKMDPGRISLTGSMHTFLMQAYQLTSPLQLAGEPEWFQTRSYAIEAVTAGPAEPEQMMLMLRRVLADRFQLKMRQEDRELPVYALEVAAGGPKFKELKPRGRAEGRAGVAGSFHEKLRLDEGLAEHVECGAWREALGGPSRGGRDAAHGPVRYALADGDDNAAEGDRKAFEFPSLFEDMQSQLGLRLVPGRAKMAYYVVEHAAEPTAN